MGGGRHIRPQTEQKTGEGEGWQQASDDTAQDPHASPARGLPWVLK